ncbi:zinc ABC transporter substrate-binding protein [Acetobacter sacchari]|uniref:Zinc ABC transporter substrate-binding protein n=1 Tax=Acetobacter sacchari TaxID=2661687 RepID=A0ABS3LSL0_9PROT|nr:zinc ABC transporter substrate-binding protein [Acetobacter sacchari]
MRLFPLSDQRDLLAPDAVRRLTRRRVFAVCAGAGVATYAGCVEEVSAMTPVRALTAEAVWRDIAVQIGGDAVAVDCVMTAPELDPHLFEPTPATARAVAAAAVLIANGGGYDAWMDRLVDAGKNSGARYIRISDVIGWREPDNTHFWYDPVIVRQAAAAIASAFSGYAGYAAPAIAARKEALLRDIDAIVARVRALRAKFSGARVAATEPFLDRLLGALGLDEAHAEFQRSVMNDVEPGPADVAAFESDLRNGRLRMLVYNAQTVTPATTRLLSLAGAARIPTISVTETLPPKLRWQDWMSGILDQIEQALSSNVNRRPA